MRNKTKMRWLILIENQRREESWLRVRDDDVR
jgi:hypothetical protein